MDHARTAAGHQAPAEPSASSYKVRLAVEADIPALIALGRMVHLENGIMPFSQRKAEETARRCVGSDNLIVGCIGPAGRPEAVICLTIGQFWYSDQPHLEELFVYVVPEYRQSKRAFALLDYAKRCARRLGVPLLVGILSQRRTEGKVRLYSRQLGKPAGAYWIYNGRTGQI